MNHPAPTDPDWWKDAIVYQIYPRSFADADGDGIGDLGGIVSRVGYLRALGVDAVWLSPFYPSPLADGGYDVSDHRAVDPRIGALEEFDKVVAALHSAGIRVVVDVVPNHSSHLHPWFQAALASPPGSPERARYIFRDGLGPDKAIPPTDWRAVFGGSVWEAAGDGQFYFHLFAPEQPDWNWDHPDVRADFLQTLRFWADRGVDGFRVDVAAASRCPGTPPAQASASGQDQRIYPNQGGSPTTRSRSSEPTPPRPCRSTATPSPPAGATGANRHASWGATGRPRDPPKRTETPAPCSRGSTPARECSASHAQAAGKTGPTSPTAPPPCPPGRSCSHHTRSLRTTNCRRPPPPGCGSPRRPPRPRRVGTELDGRAAVVNGRPNAIRTSDVGTASGRPVFRRALQEGHGPEPDADRQPSDRDLAAVARGVTTHQNHGTSALGREPSFRAPAG
ncbi:MAG: hypothetical protein LBE08_10950 [Bifidobacteriaceae bacterium]|nr:hypothetical protein [Bifidobacteriaceae bacterium]